jgi:hypothetical protein
VLSLVVESLHRAARFQRVGGDITRQSGVAKPLDTNATGQATFYGCFENVGCEEGERDGHIDLPNAALLARAKFCDRRHRLRVPRAGVDQKGAQRRWRPLTEVTLEALINPLDGHDDY